MININLHPEGGKARKKSGSGVSLKLPSFEGIGGLDALRDDPWRAGLVICVIVIPVAILGMWFTQRSHASELESRLESAVTDSTRLADLRALSDSLMARQAEIRDRIALIETLDGGRFVWPHLLDEISAALPSSAWITAMDKRSPLPELSVQLEAVATTPMTITEFVRALDRSRYIGSVRIVSSQRQVNDGRVAHAFTLIIHYSRPAEVVETAPLIAGGN